MEIDSQTGLVLEGGGMRAIFTVGVLDYFMDHDIWFPYTIGVSAGASNGIYRSEFLVLCLSGFVLSVGLRYLFQVQGSVRYGHEQLLDG